MKLDQSNRRMIRWPFGLFVAVALGSSTTLHAQEVTAKASLPAKTDPLIAQLVEGHNKERAKEGLPPLKLEARLQEAAKIQAKDMAEHDMMSHDGSDGSTPAQRIARVGYHYISTGENVARGYRDVPSVMAGWMDSPPHKKNILGDYTEIGLSMELGAEGKPFWAVEFGKPMPQLDPSTAATDLIKRINDERAVAKLPLLVVDDRLAKAAKDQAANLSKKKSQGGGTATFDGIDQKLYSDLALSTAAGQPDVESVVKTLMAGDDLKKQVLGKFARIGVGYATSEDGLPYWCLILANPSRTAIEGKSKVNNR